MKRVVVALVAAIGLFFGARAILRALESEETKIRRVVDAMVEGFNDTRMNPILDGLDAKYLDETYGADRQLLRAAAASVFFQAKDPATKKFLYRAEWRPAAPIAIDEGAQTPSAKLDLEVDFFHRRGETEALAWKVLVHGELAKVDGDWRFVRTETVTQGGERIR